MTIDAGDETLWAEKAIRRPREQRSCSRPHYFGRRVPAEWTLPSIEERVESRDEDERAGLCSSH